jgi:hypothetical protein
VARGVTASSGAISVANLPFHRSSETVLFGRNPYRTGINLKKAELLPSET